MSSGSNGSVRTRFLVIADTHGFQYMPDTKPLQPIDVVIHCGDITANSQLFEYKKFIQLLSTIDAPLKLVIPGNHDFTLDTPTYQCLLAHPQHQRHLRLTDATHGPPGAARQLFAQAQKQQQHHHPAGTITSTNTNNIHYLDEGTHRFPLPNGTLLTVYASSYTPAFGTPGFQYTPQESHDFAVPDDVDVVITHGPPKGVRDRSWVTRGVKHVGSEELWTAVARAKPRLHCFGHIHEGWGAEVVRWGREKDETGDDVGEAVGCGERALVADLGSVLPLKKDTAEAVAEKKRRLGEYAAGKCVRTSHCAGEVLPVEKGVSTVFVNAAVAGEPVRPAWVVDLDLPVAKE